MKDGWGRALSVGRAEQLETPPEAKPLEMPQNTRERIANALERIAVALEKIANSYGVTAIEVFDEEGG